MSDTTNPQSTQGTTPQDSELDELLNILWSIEGDYRPGESFNVDQKIETAYVKVLQWANKRAERDKQALYTALVEQMPEAWKPRNPDSNRALGYNEALTEVHAVLSSVLGKEKK